MIHHLCRAALLLALLPALPQAQAAGPAPQGRVCHLPGVEEGLRCHRVPVALDYQRPDGEPLALHVAVAPAFREAARSDPLFVLAGGPGQAGSDVLAVLGALRKIRATRDIVLIDQRGTGLSGKLDCESKGRDTENLGEAALEAEARDCLLGLGKPLAAYTTASAARDIEQVRLALGYGKINLWGASYGSRLGQAYARAFPASVRAVILDGVAAPEQVIPAGGRDGHAALDALFKLCAADAGCAKTYPALRAEFKAVAERVAAGKVKLQLPDPRTTEQLTLAMSSTRFMHTVHAMLYSPADSRRLPFLIHNAYQGRWEPFVARSNVMRDYTADGALAFGLHLAVVCAEDVPRLTPQLLADDSPGAFMPLALIGRLCQAIKVPAVPYAEPATIEAPVLLLSGYYDPVTPPRRAESAARHMSRAQHLVVRNAGHGVSGLGCAPRLLREFLDRPLQKVAAACLEEIPAPTFQLGPAGPQP